MKLVYLYVAECAGLRGRELNFVSEYRCRYAGGVFSVRRGNDYFKGFFSTDPGAAYAQVTATALIGENGTGKTSVAFALNQLLASPDALGEYIAVIEIDGMLRIYSGGLHGLRVDVDPLLPCGHCYCEGEAVRMDMALNRFSVLYYSPIYNAQRAVATNGDEFVDLSTTGLLEELPERFINEGMPSAYGIFQTAALNAFDTKWTLQFVCEMHRKFGRQKGALQRELEMALPSRCLLLCNDRSLGPVLKDVERWGLSGGRSADLMRQVFQFDYANDAFVRIFVCYAGNFLRAANQSRIPVPLECTYSMRLLRFVVALYGHFHGKKFLPNDMPALHGRILRFFIRAEEILKKLSAKGLTVSGTPARIAAARSFFEYLLVLGCGIHGRAVGECSAFGAYFESAEQREALLGGIDCYEKSKLITDYVVFKFMPAPSSGEMAFLSMWGRLYHGLGEIDARSGGRPYDVLLFLDEAETSLHPTWQRLLVYGLVWFCEKFFPRARAHLVFASHSPHLLSDMPRDHVVMLGSREDHEKRGTTLRRGVRSFACSIAGLYRDVYGLKDGPYGVLSQRKLEHLFERIRQRDGSFIGPREESVIDEIGDELIRTYLKHVGR